MGDACSWSGFPVSVTCLLVICLSFYYGVMLVLGVDSPCVFQFMSIMGDACSRLDICRSIMGDARSWSGFPVRVTCLLVICLSFYYG